MNDIKVHCAFDKMVDITELVPHNKNPNKHGDAQVALLAKIIRHTGWRSPIVVSKRSGFIVAGHGRLEAGKLLGCQSVPVNFQEFADEATEWAHLAADNRIAELAETDGAALKDLLIDLDSLTADFDMDLSGFTKDELERVINSYHEKGENDPSGEWAGMPEFKNEPRAHRSIIVHFKTADDVAAFLELIGQSVTDETRYIWHPKQVRKELKPLAYKGEK